MEAFMGGLLFLGMGKDSSFFGDVAWEMELREKGEESGLNALFFVKR
jgi:hypothetical protein